MDREEKEGSAKPKSVPEYVRWLKDRHGLEISDRIRTHYDAVAGRLERDFTASQFWTALGDALKTFHEQYVVATGYPLFRSFVRPKVLTKPFESFLMKTFSRNVTNNVNWPDAPPGDWLLHPQWFSDVNDTLRARFEVKYLDGVAFLADRLVELGESAGFGMNLLLQARPEGYYAAHIDARREFEIPMLTWNTERRLISVELQITTQLQEVILQLTHKFYEERRRRHTRPGIAWQWDYSSLEFVGNYLGHILHYVEGMIMDVREKQRR